MTEGKEHRFFRLKTYAFASLVTLLFFSVVIWSVVIFLPRGGAAPSYLLVLFLFLPLTPLFLIWLYALYRALIPVTGGMPAKGFRQWALAYIYALGLLLYWALWALVLDIAIPSIDMEYREAIFPLLILAATQLILTKSTRYRQLISRAFRTETPKAGQNLSGGQ